MKNILYANRNNVGFSLNCSNFKLLNIDDIFSLEYETDIVNNNIALSKKIKTIELEFDVITTKNKTWQDTFNELLKIIDGDVGNGKQGTLHYGDYRIDCNLCDVRLKDVNMTQFYVTGTMKLISNFVWRKQKDYHFAKIGTMNNPKQYTHSYPYTYEMTNASATLFNESYQPSHFAIFIYGAVNNPSIVIGNNAYTVNEYVEEDEVLTILYVSEATKTITKSSMNGEKVNCFDKRDKSHEFFKKIAPGTNNVSWNGTFEFNVTIYDERGIPK